MKGSAFGALIGIAMVFAGGILFVAMDTPFLIMTNTALEMMPAENNASMVASVNRNLAVWQILPVIVMLAGVIYILFEAQRREPETVYYG